MFGLKVVVALVPLFLSQALPSMAAGLQVPRGESATVISALLRHAKGTRSVAGDIHIRQTTCPAGSFECSDGKGCCDIGYDCVVIDGLAGCCRTGSTCGGDPVCQDPTENLCPGAEFCCPPGDECFSDFTCGSGGGGGGSTSTSTSQRPTSAVVPSTSSVLAPSASVTQQTSSVGPALVPTTSSTRSVTTSANVVSSTGIGSTTTPNGITNGATLAASHSLVVCAAFVVALLPL